MTIEIYNHAQCSQWLVAHDYTFNLDCWRTQVVLPNLKYSICFLLPVDIQCESNRSGVQSLANLFSNWHEHENSLLVFSDSFAMAIDQAFGMPDELATYSRVRSSDNSDAYEHCPRGFCWNSKVKTNRSTLCDVFQFLMQSNWEGLSLAADRNTLVWLADEVIEIRTSKEHYFRTLKRVAHKLQLDVFILNGERLEDDCRPFKISN